MTRQFLAILTTGALLAGSVAEALADGGRMRVKRDDCRRLVQHRPDPDVAYKPGVDVRGKPVKPADLPGGLNLEPADDVEFEISFNPLRGGTGGRFGSTELYVGRVKVDLKSGAVTFNDIPLTDPEQAELAAKCREILRRR
jgi:hypothetical protein